MRGFSNFPIFYHDRDVVLWAKAWWRTSPQRCLETWSFGTGDLSIFSSSDHLSKCRYLAGKRSQRYFDVKISPEYQMWLLRFSFLCVCRSRDVCEEIKANFPEGKVRRDAIYMNALRCCFTIRTWSRILASQIFFNLRFVSLGIPKVFLILFLYQFMSLKQQIIIAATAAEVVRACEYTFCMLSTMEASVAVVRRTFFILRSSFCLLFL